MSLKRQQDDGKSHRSDGNSSDDKRRKVPALRNVILEVMRLRAVQHFMEPVLEPLIRRVVKEEVDTALRKYLTSMKRNCGKEIFFYETRTLQLQFSNAISLPVFTGTRIEGIEGEECSALKVALVDAGTGQIVSSGPESSAKVEIVVLEGDFDGEEGNNWTIEEFKSNIVREREGKKALLSGDAFLYLKEGLGLVGEISFTDNSSWTRSRKFRLGARVVDNFNGIGIREAKTESFIVRDHRGELYKKHHPPALHDEVWRLEKIGKDGAFHRRLSKEKVYTVKDFLTLLCLDPMRLRNILGTGMSAKMWEATVDHARTCVLDKKLYLYCPGSQVKTGGVFFNVVGQLMGVLSEINQYISIDKLSESEKEDGHNLVISAFRNWHEVISFDDEASFMKSDSTPYNSMNSPMEESSDGNKIVATSDQKTAGRICDYDLSNGSPDIISSICSMGIMTGLDDFGLHNMDPMDICFDQTLSFANNLTNCCPLIFDTANSMSQAFCDDEHHQQYFCPFQDSSLQESSQTDLHTAVSGFLLGRSGNGFKSQRRRWKILFSVLRWFSIRRIVAKKSRLVCL